MNIFAALLVGFLVFVGYTIISIPDLPRNLWEAPLLIKLFCGLMAVGGFCSSYNFKK